MAAISVGSVSVTVVPSVKNFAKDLQGKLSPEAAALGDELGKVMANRIQAQLKNLKASLGVDNKVANAKIDETSAKLDEFGHKRATATANVNVKGLSGLQSMNKLLLAGTAAALAFGPATVGLAAGVAGAGVALGSAAVGAGAFAAIAIPMFKKVTTAQGAYTKAQGASTKAHQAVQIAEANLAKQTTKAGRAKALTQLKAAETTYQKALAAQKATMAGLSPAEQKLALSIDKLKTSWGGLNKAMQPLVARSLVPWFATAQETIGLLPNLIRPAASAIQFLGSQAKTVFSEPLWKTFTKNLGSSGKIAMQGFGNALLNVATAGAILFDKFKPWIDKIGPLVAKWGGDFLTWAQNYKTSGFQHFMSYVASQGPALKRVWDNLTAALPKVAAAFKDMPSITLNALADVLGILAKMSPAQIQALAYAYAAAKLGGTIGGLGGGALGKTAKGSGKLAGAARIGNAGLSALPGVALGVSADMQGRQKTLGGKLTTIGQGAAGGALAGASIGSLFGPVGMGVGAGAGALVGGGIAAVHQFLPQIESAFGAAIKWIKNNWTTILPAILTDGLSIPFTMFLPQIKRAFGSAIGWIKNNWTKILPAILTGGLSIPFTMFGPQMLRFGKNLISGLASGIAGAAKNIGSALYHDVYAPVVGYFKSTGTWLWSKGSALVQGLGSGIWSAAKSVGSWLYAYVYAPIVGYFKGVGSWLWSKGLNLIYGIGNGIIAASRSIGSWLYGHVYSPVVNYFKGVGSWLWSKGLNLIYGLGNGLIAAAKSVGGWLYSHVYAPVVGYFKAVGTWLWTKGLNLIYGLGNGLIAAAKSIGSWLYGHVYSPVVNYFKAVGAWLWNKGWSLVQGLGNGLIARAKALGGWLYGHVYSPVVNYFRNAGSWLWNHGWNLIQGLLGGMANRMKSIGSWIKGNVVDPIVNWIKHHFGIKSPSTVMAELGNHLTSGLIKGIVSGDPGGFIRKIFGSNLLKDLGNFVKAGAIKLAEIPGNLLGKLQALGAKIGGWFESLFGVKYNPSAGVGQWRSTVLRALQLNGLPASLVNQVLKQIATESGGNPNAINRTDSNAAAGDPSRGLLQTIGSTFAAYHVRGTSNNIYDPLANIAAAINYAKHVYGPSLMRGGMGLGSGHGYDSGGYLPPGHSVVYNGTGKPEPVFTSKQWASIERGGLQGRPSLVDTLNVNVAQSGATAGDIISAASYELRKVRMSGVYG